MSDLYKEKLEQYVNSLSKENKEIYDTLLDVVCEVMDVSKDLIFTRSRISEVVFARHAFRFNLKRYIPNMTLKLIGRITHMPAADHSTVINSNTEWRSMINSNYNKKKYRQIQNQINDKTIQFVGQVTNTKPFLVNGNQVASLEEVRNELALVNVDFDFSFFDYKIE